MFQVFKIFWNKNCLFPTLVSTAQSEPEKQLPIVSISTAQFTTIVSRLLVENEFFIPIDS